jgi:hypothetical protein
MDCSNCTVQSNRSTIACEHDHRPDPISFLLLQIPKLCRMEVASLPGLGAVGAEGTWMNNTNITYTHDVYAISPRLTWCIHYLSLYYTPILVVCGILLNSVTALTFSRTKLNQCSCAPYVVAMAISDACFLVTLLLVWCSQLDFYVLSSGAWCQAITYASYVCTFLPKWFVVGFTFDRFVNLRLPHLENSLCSSFHSKVVVTMLVIIAVVVYLNISLLSGVVTLTNGSLSCVPLPQFAHTLQTLSNLDLTINLLLPFIITLSLNTMIARRLCFMFKQRKSFVSTYSASRRRSCRNGPLPWRPLTDLRMSRALLVLSMVFIALNLPSNMIRLWVVVKGLFKSDFILNTNLLLWHQTFQFLFFTRCGVTFFVVFFASSCFRRNLKLCLLGACATCCPALQPRVSRSYYDRRPSIRIEDIQRRSVCVHKADCITIRDLESLTIL